MPSLPVSSISRSLHSQISVRGLWSSASCSATRLLPPRPEASPARCCVPLQRRHSPRVPGHLYRPRAGDHANDQVGCSRRSRRHDLSSRYDTVSSVSLYPFRCPAAHGLTASGQAMLACLPEGPLRWGEQRQELVRQDAPQHRHYRRPLRRAEEIRTAGVAFDAEECHEACSASERPQRIPTILRTFLA